MFFLVYVPSINKRLSADEIDQMAEQFADQLLAQAVISEGDDIDELPDELRSAIKAQVINMMTSMQQRHTPGAEGAEPAPEGESAPDGDSAPAVAESGEVRDFLERCFKRSA